MLRYFQRCIKYYIQQQYIPACIYEYPHFYFQQCYYHINCLSTLYSIRSPLLTALLGPQKKRGAVSRNRTRAARSDISPAPLRNELRLSIQGLLRGPLLRPRPRPRPGVLGAPAVHARGLRDRHAERHALGPRGRFLQLRGLRGVRQPPPHPPRAERVGARGGQPAAAARGVPGARHLAAHRAGDPPAGPGRAGAVPAQCSQRWARVANPAIRKGKWSPAEDAQLVAAIVGSPPRRWRLIADKVQGRTDIQVRYRLQAIGEGLVRQRLIGRECLPE
uniref:Myb-like DNA-binding domain-containing protein n=2 Tax=Spironucleus salmonicida TaxID=348837 RepID=V6LU04_9EUKA|eukprot:EST48147.1 Myb-like DNA-binding domain-containing protein [Spironucleus salmonicida]